MLSYSENNISYKYYKEMLRIRLVEEAIAERYGEQKMRCPVHLSIGQEAIAVGVCSSIANSDYMISNHRAHAHYLAKGGDLKKMIAELYGKKTGCSMGRGGSMHLVDLSVGMMGATPIVGGSIPVAVGISFACKLQNKNAITVVFFGEGATEEGVFVESLNFAALHDLPILFVCENNYFSVYTELFQRQPPQRSRIGIAKANGVESLMGYGNDVESVASYSRIAVNHIQNNKKPYFLEFSTYRHREHCGPNYDDQLGYRDQAELNKWLENCPLKIQKSRLSDLTPNIEESLKRSIKDEISIAFEFAESSETEMINHDEECYA